MRGPVVSASPRYSQVAVVFHWTIAALVAANLAIGLLHESLLPGTIPLHKAIGLTVLALTAARIVWRVGHRRRRCPPKSRPGRGEVPCAPRHAISS